MTKIYNMKWHFIREYTTRSFQKRFKIMSVASVRSFFLSCKNWVVYIEHTLQKTTGVLHLLQSCIPASLLELKIFTMNIPLCLLVEFRPMFPFYTLWEHQNIYGFLVSGRIEIENSLRMGLSFLNNKINFLILILSTCPCYRNTFNLHHHFIKARNYTYSKQHVYRLLFL